jgi:prolyl oligopeptidase
MALRNSSPEARKASRQSECFFPSALLLGAFLMSAGFLAGCYSQKVPAASRQPVASAYHGESVSEDYQWLEAGTNPSVRAWTAAQNARAREFLDRTESRPLVAARLQELFSKTSPNYSAFQWSGGWLFYLEFKPPAQQPILKVLKTLTGTNDPDHAEVVVDPNKLSSDGSTSIDWFVPSADGKLVAVSLSEKGTESGTLYFFETATGRKLPDAVPGVNGATAGGSAAWNADGTGIFYTRYPRHGERPEADLPFYQQVYFHQLGTPTERDRYEIGKEFPRIAEIELEPSPDHRWMLATAANGDGGDFAHWLRSPNGAWRQITRFEDGVKAAKFGRDPIFIEWPRDTALYLLSKKDAPKGKILRVPLAQPDLANARVALAQDTNTIAAFAPSASGLYVAYLDGGPMELVFFDYAENKAWQLAPIIPQRRRSGDTNEVVVAPTAVQEMLVTRGDEFFYRTVTHTEPFKWFRYNPLKDRQTVETTDFVGESPAEFGDVEAVREFVTSKDGTKVPLTIVRKKGTRLTGDNPTLLTGYGGYGISLVPNFRFTDRLWLDQGGIIAIANLRGGGEYGEDWHKAGNLTRKQNVFDDFIACAEFLIRSNYTSPQRLAIQGGSNGGLLMGAALTQRPDLFGAVVSHVGIYDMLRVELDPNGEFNVTEFGTVKDRAQFQALRAYSPYHNVKNGTPYPPVLFMTGENDGRVNPAHSRKMTARLQAGTAAKQPVLLRTSANTGHGMGTPLDARIAELADVYAFLFDRLGMFYSEVDRGPWVGAVTPDSAVVKARLARPQTNARLVLTEDETLRKRSYAGHDISDTNHGNIVKFTLTGLKPDTRYFYALETDGRLDRTKRGEFRTFPEGRASFSIAFASCARTGSTNEVFDRIREHRPLFYMNMGDFHYLNISTNVRAKFRSGYDAVLASPQQSDLYRHVPFVYIWDDHDFGGNNVGGRSNSREAARLTYQEYVPHYPLGAGSGNVPIYQSFNVGRVKFILTDLRSERDALTNKDDAAKSMMSAPQKAWFKEELLSAKGKFPLICWVSSVPWLGEKGSNYYRGVKTNQFGYIHHTNLVIEPSTNSTSTSTNRGRGRRGGAQPPDDDHWSRFATERREIVDFIKSNHITGVCILHGDSHMLAADDGRNGDYATGGGLQIPVMCAGPLDQDPSLKGGPYSEGVYRVRKGEGCFGLLTVTDKGDVIDVSYSGRNNRDEEKVRLKFSVPANGIVGQASSRSP